MFICL